MKRLLEAALIRAPNRLAPVRELKRRLLPPGLQVRVLRGESELRRWLRPSWISLKAQAATLEECLADPPRRIVAVATWRRWLLGRAQGSFMWQRVGVPGWWLGSVWVSGWFRGLGIGERLTAAIEHYSALIGHEEILLNVAEPNRAARALYLKRGYTLLERPEWKRAIESHLRQKGMPSAQLILGRPLPAPNADRSR